MVKAIKEPGYVCNSCGYHASIWSGKCPQCSQWNTLDVEVYIKQSSSTQSLNSESLIDGLKTDEFRMISGIASIDQVFGGGIVNGSVNLISGEPGMGKSTLLLQLASALAKDSSVLYVSGEESLHQVSMRAKRLGLKPKKLQIASSNNADEITDEIISSRHQLVVIDSIQTLKCEGIGAAAGSVSQVTNSASMLATAAKASNTAIIIVGHVTKEGAIAGPKLLEHIVDVVLSLEGDNSGGLKLLRVTKNRFGSTNETAIFEMKNEGLMAVDNPSAVLLEERKNTDGSIVLATIEGSRPILVEVQALVNATSYGYPKRAVSGFELSRLNLLIAMMERRTTLKLGDKDIFVNIVGGLKVAEPAADLAVVMAIASASRGKKLKDNAVVFGEVGLSGEVRHVPFIDKRIKEALSLGFAYAIGPKPPGKAKADSNLMVVDEVKNGLNTYLT